ncbi:MAG: HAMP domain-containing protein [Leptolyngbya sp. SIOISBB]|nr:HAMP domain-containing protein [Leptolyngbya sp. SIOISBB]
MVKSSLKPSTRIPLRSILTVPFVAQIFLVVGLVGYLSYSNGQKAVDNLANRLIEKTDKLVEKHLDSFLAAPQQLNALASDAVKTGLLDLQNFDAAGRYFWYQSQTFNVSWAGYALPTGELVGAGAIFENQGVTIAELSQRTDGQLYNYKTDSEGNRQEVVDITEYDPLSYDWYLTAVNTKQATWSPIHVEAEFGDYVTATAVHPIYDDNQQLMGVLAVDHLLSDINNFLSELNISPSGKVFIIERNGQLVASSSTEEIYTLSEGQADRLVASNSPDPLIQATAQQLQQQFGELDAIQGHQSLQFRVDGERQFVGVTPWQDEYGLDWLLVGVVPESDFASEIYANTRLTILLCILALFVSTGLGILTARWITQPILNLSQASAGLAKAARDRFADGESDQPVSGSGIDELNTLAESFNQMADQLRTSFTELQSFNNELENRVEIRTTELRETLEELRRAQLQMIQSEKMSALGQMVAGVAHEVNNPINFIYGNLSHAETNIQDLLDLIDLAQQEQLSTSPAFQKRANEIELDFLAEDLPKLMQSMRVGAERIQEIVKSLRVFSRLDEAEFKSANIHEGIDSTLMILQNRIKKHSDRPEIEVIKTYGKLPEIECYPRQLNQVFMNILSNAVDALEEAMVNQSLVAAGNRSAIPSRSSFQIRIETEATADQQAIIRIADNGPGISPEIVQRLFDPFFTTKQIGQGTGMGLAISHEIIAQKHSGHLRCISQPNQGTEFVIEIPIKQKSTQ